MDEDMLYTILRSGRIGLNRLCCLAGGFPRATSTILKITYLKSGRTVNISVVIFLVFSRVSLSAVLQLYLLHLAIVYI